MQILSFDVESNGLHGKAFAVAGVLMDSNRRILSQFMSRCRISGPVDQWVSDNVLGPMKAVPETAPTAKAMRAEFWAWYQAAKAESDLIVAANPYPVEARFLIACQEDDLPGRGFDHPFPYYDLSSMLYTLGITNAAARREFVAGAVAGAAGQAHNPLWDATAAAMAAHLAVRPFSAPAQPSEPEFK